MIAGQGWCGKLKGVFALPSGSASEPSGNLAPRLDRRGACLPWARRHFIISQRHGKGRAVLGERGGACSRGANAGSRLLIPSVVIAVARARRRPSVGDGSRRAVVTGPARTGVCAGASRTDGIGNAGVSGRWRGRQLTCRRRARVSAQHRATKILASGCVIGRAVMSGSRCGTSIRAGVSAASYAAWRCDGCWTGRHVIGSGAGAGGVNE